LTAARVLATDHYVWNHSVIRGRDSFELARSVLNIDLEVRDIDIPDLSPDSVGTFDIVLFLGVFYHLLDPIAFEQMAKLAREALIVETHTDALEINRPAMIMYPGAELSNDPSNWWGTESGMYGSPVEGIWFRQGRCCVVKYCCPISLPRLATDALRRTLNPDERVIELNWSRRVHLKYRPKLGRGWRLIRNGLGLRRER